MPAWNVAHVKTPACFDFGIFCFGGTWTVTKGCRGPDDNHSVHHDQHGYPGYRTCGCQSCCGDTRLRVGSTLLGQPGGMQTRLAIPDKRYDAWHWLLDHGGLGGWYFE